MTMSTSALATMFSEESTVDSKNWATPRGFLWDAQVQLGVHYTLDAAASWASRVCERYFGPDHDIEMYRDAFQLSWLAPDPVGITSRGTTFLNPPYGRGLINWMSKAKEEAKTGAEVHVLIPARTDTQWWHKHVMQGAREVHFIEGRLTFLNPETMTPLLDKKGKPQPAPFPSALIVYRGECDHPTFWSF